MRLLAFWKAVTMDHVDLLKQFVDVLRELGVRYCVVGGQGVNAYVEPLVSLDLHVVVAADQLEYLESRLPKDFDVERFPHSLNISQAGSDLRIQLQTDPRYARFLNGAVDREVLGVTMPVAAVEDVLQGKIWAVTDEARRPSKRQKDLADVARLLEKFPHLRPRVPAPILAKLV
ncbi:MAG TPA: hypothetical protein VGZ27_08225 [Vicinamibacterales bacterium]|jgi:hypothetical protein|nr:hypothetical protein [Vicinamibacterales bacterium]